MSSFLFTPSEGDGNEKDRVIAAAKVILQQALNEIWTAQRILLGGELIHEPTMDERRGTKRQRTLKAGKIEVGSGGAIDCTVGICRELGPRST